METNKKILFIHPEGNINNNPNLSGIAEVLCEYGHTVTILSPRRRFPQIAPCRNSNFILYSLKIHSLLLKLISDHTFNRIVQFFPNRILRFFWDYQLIMGIDREGIIFASFIAEQLNVPYGLISYEIFFESETSKSFKDIERSACKKISFAICQDNIRSIKLSTENEIALDKIIKIPVAGRFSRPGGKSNYLHELLGIDYNKKIALCAGSMAKWTMIDKLCDNVQFWPDDWVLILHERYGNSSEIERKYTKTFNEQKIFISKDLILTPNDIYQLMHSVDLGIALYEPTYDSMWTGKNLKYLGLSSGKISTYLQHGVPVLTNRIGLMENLIYRNKIGYVIEDFSQIPEILQKHNLMEYREDCFHFFEKCLDLNKNIGPLLTKINNLMQTNFSNQK